MLGFSSTIIALAVILISYILHKILPYILITYRVRQAAKKLPSTPHHWLYGHLKEFPSLAKIIKFGRELTIKYSKVNVIWTGFFRPVIRVVHPDTVKLILRTSAPKSGAVTGVSGYGLLRPWLGDGLLISNGKKWERNRKLLTPAFHFDILKSYMKIYNTCAQTLTEVLEDSSKSAKKSVEICEPVSNATLDVMLQCAFSYEGNVQATGDNHPYVHAVKRLEDLIYERAIENSKILEKKYLDFVDILLTARDNDGRGLTHEEIRWEVDTFLFEGHDTTASGLYWILYSLAQEPEIQEKLYEEIMEVVGEEEDVAWENLNSFTYMTKVIKETFRMHAPVFAISRDLIEPLVIEGVELPKGTTVAINIDNMNHNPTVWDDPEVFDPDRFNFDKATERDPFHFVPFSAGSRNCIGQNFAMNEEKVLISHIIRKFRLAVDETHTVERYPALVMRAKYGIKLLFEKR